MKYYSEKLSEAKGRAMTFDSPEKLEEAEKEYDEKHAVELRRAEERKNDAKKVEDAYKRTLEVRREASKAIDDADRAYREARDAFVKKHGSYHMTYTNSNGKELLTFGDLWDDFFDRLFW